MIDHLDQRVANKTFSRSFEQDRREVQRYAASLRSIDLEQAEQAAITGAQVEHAPDSQRYMIQNDGFPSVL